MHLLAEAEKTYLWLVQRLEPRVKGVGARKVALPARKYVDSVDAQVKGAGKG